jgi:excisionase family DNA binding protein
MQTATPSLLSPKDIATRTGLTQRTVQEAIKTGRIKNAIKLNGSRWRVSEQSYEQWLEAGRYTPDFSKGHLPQVKLHQPEPGFYAKFAW